MRPARLGYLLILDSPEIDDALEGAPELEVEVRLRATDGGRFDEAVSGRAAMTLEALPPWAQHQVARCQRYATLEAESDPEQATARLRAAEWLLQQLADEGELTFALCRCTSVWRHRDQLQREFSVEDHFVVVVEAVERAPGAGHLVRTRGLGKFGQPDVGMRTPRANADEVAELVRKIARRGAEGEPFLPGRRLPGTSLALWPRTEDCLSSAPAETAPLYELREGGLSLVR